MKKIIGAIFIFVFSATVGYYIINWQATSFEELNSDEMYEEIIKNRNYAIAKAVKAGEYKCCINPPCAMCYMEANQWNNYKAGTCACDDLVAQGQEACPQCRRGNTEIDNLDNASCDIDIGAASCSSPKVE
ncbi:MAG: hypothetical protein ABIE43_02185 [Patescibacteria group bacterium]